MSGHSHDHGEGHLHAHSHGGSGGGGGGHDCGHEHFTTDAGEQQSLYPVIDSACPLPSLFLLSRLQSDACLRTPCQRTTSLR